MDDLKIGKKVHHFRSEKGIYNKRAFSGDQNYSINA